MLLTTTKACLLAFLLCPFAPQAPPVALDPGDVCDSVCNYNHPTQLFCFNPCTQGCNRLQVTTNENNPGYTCNCDIVGPTPICCKVAYVSEWAWELVGSCNSVGCESGECLEFWLYDPENRKLLVGFAGKCQ